jgi:hypothetical protein
MNKLLYSLFLSLFFLNYFHYRLAITPRFTTWVPEVLAVLTFLVVALQLGFRRKFSINSKYIILILLFLAIMLIGIVLNGVQAGPIFVGIRVYLKHLPFFLLPAVYDFSDEQFKKQLLFILPLLILQCPLAVYQRLFQYRGVITGDVITGTLRVSGTLSIVMICSIAVIFALYLKKKIGFKLFVITACCLFLPTTLNETKVTLFLFPVALVLPAFLFHGEGSSKTKSLLTMGLIGVLFISAFIPIYDHFMKPRSGLGIVDYLRLEREGRGYLYHGSEGETGEKVGRFDTIILSYRDVSKDLGTLMFGLGIGNVLDTYFQGFSGDASKKLQYAGGGPALPSLLWEVGLSGVVVYVAFFCFLFRDALLLRNSDDIFGSFALGWSAVIAIIGISLVYNNFMRPNILNFMFWYFSGVVAAKASAMRSLPQEYTVQRVSGEYHARHDDLKE